MFHDPMKENSMSPFHFKSEIIHLLTWFNDSPDTGDPTCICSYCGEIIEEGEIPFRIFRESNNTEIRLHIKCGEQVIVEIAPKQTLQEIMAGIELQTRNSPAYAEGQAAFTEGKRRGSNPYSGNPYRKDWFAGWDAAWEGSNKGQSKKNSVA